MAADGVDTFSSKKHIFKLLTWFPRLRLGQAFIEVERFIFPCNVIHQESSANSRIIQREVTRLQTFS